MQDGADHEPSGNRAITSPDPAFPENTNPALMTWNTANPNNRKRMRARIMGRQIRVLSEIGRVKENKDLGRAAGLLSGRS